MSIQAVSWALQQRVEDAAAKLVLISLANHANHRTGLCWPTVALIAEEASQSERTVQRKLPLLEEGGFIRIERRPNQSSRYFLQLERAEPVSEEEGCHPVTSTPGGDNSGGAGDSVAPRGDTVVTRGGDTVGGTIEPESSNLQKPSTHPNPPRRGQVFVRFGLQDAVLSSALDAIATVAPTDASGTQAAAADALRAAGFDVDVEAHVHDRGDGRAGRVDIIAERSGVDVAIELDNETMRAKSLRKLAHCDGFKVGVLRSSDARSCPPGLDALVVLAPATPVVEGAVWIAKGSPQWDAWEVHKRAQRLVGPAGMSASLDPVRNEWGRLERTEWPPGHSPPPARAQLSLVR